MDRFVKKTARGPGNSLPSHLIKSSSMSIDRYLVKTRRVSNNKDRDKRSSREDDDECCARDDSEEICVLDETDHSVSASNSTVLKTSSGTNSGRSRWKSSSSVKKQSTIHSLPSVVVIEEIQALKTKLKLANQSADVLVQCLKDLEKKVPPRHVLQSTKIGHIVSKLKKHDNEVVAQTARRVYTKWRKYFEEKMDRPQIEVRCDNKTEKFRLTGKTRLSQVLGVETTHDLVEGIERETFHTHQRRLCPAYSRSMRNFYFKIKSCPQLRLELVTGALPVEEFVKQYKKS